MTNARINELINLGFDKAWLNDIQEGFKSKSNGDYVIEIYDCEELDQDIETGIFIGMYFFDDDRDLSVIHHFFEGMFYIMKVAKTNEKLGKGIVDGSPFYEMEEYDPEGKAWYWWLDKELGDDFVERNRQREQRLLEYNKNLIVDFECEELE